MATQAEDDQDLPELMAEIPQNTVTLEEAMQKLRSGYPAPALIRVHSTLMTDQHEDLVDPYMCCANFVHDMIPPENSLVMLCRKWGKLRDRSAEEARVLTASSQARCAILDTGASRTVIGKAFAQQFASQLAPEIRERIRTGKSQTVFRFGNNGVLPNVFAMFIPLGKGWFRVEVVEGKTPFLLSNAFLRKIGGVLDFEQVVLRIPKWQRQAELALDRKGLYKVDMVRLLDGLECQQSNRESESESIWHASTTDDRPNATVAASDLDLACAKSPSFPEPERHGPLHRSRSRQPPGAPHRSDPDHLVHHGRGESTGGHQQPPRVGQLCGSGGQAPRQDIPRDLPARSRLWEVYQKSPPHLKVLAKLSKLSHRHGECDPSGEEQEPNHGTHRPGSDGDDPSHDPNDADVRRQDDGHSEAQQDTSLSESRPASSPSGRPKPGKQQLEAIHVVGSCGDRGGSSANEEGPHSGSGAGDQDPNGDPSEGARQCQGLQVGVLSPACDISGAEASDDATATALNAEQLLFLEGQLQALCLQCEHAVKELECHLRPASSPHGRTSSKVPRTFLEINIGNVGRIGGHINLHGGTLLEHSISRNSLRNASYETQLWQKMGKDVPRHVWVSVGIQQMTPAESQRVSDLCLELYWEQISRGDHFHVWFVGGIPWDVSTRIEEILMGAFQTRYCLIEGLPKLSQKYPGNNHLRRQVQFYTTSKEMHSRLDHRYLPRGAGSQNGKTLKGSPESYRYAGGLSQNVARVVGRLGTETPMLHEELCSVAIGKRDPEITRLEGEQILKRRRYLQKGPPKVDDGYGKNLDTLKEIHLKAPRVGNHIIPPGDPLVLRVQNLVPNLKVHHVEACRGTNRLRIPVLRDNPAEISHRLTVIMHRETGEVKEVGPIEDWTSPVLYGPYLQASQV